MWKISFSSIFKRNKMCKINSHTQKNKNKVYENLLIHIKNEMCKRTFFYTLKKIQDLKESSRTHFILCVREESSTQFILCV